MATLGYGTSVFLSLSADHTANPGVIWKGPHRYKIQVVGVIGDILQAHGYSEVGREVGSCDWEPCSDLPSESVSSACQPSFKFTQTWGVDLAEILCLWLPAQSRQELFYILGKFYWNIKLRVGRMLSLELEGCSIITVLVVDSWDGLYARRWTHMFPLVHTT